MLTNIQGSLLGVMIGDAMGMPVESMGAREILEYTSGQGIVGFQASTRRAAHDGFEMEAGQTTDDWQLTAAVAQSLIRSSGFSLVDQALAHIAAYEQNVGGWGRTTRTSIQEIRHYFDSRGEVGRSPWQTASVKVDDRGRPISGLGNGIAMKVAPLALYSVIEYPNNQNFSYDGNTYGKFEFPELATRVAALGGMTHGDPRAWAAAYAVAVLISEILLFRTFQSYLNRLDHKHWLLQRLIDKCLRFEKFYGVSQDFFTERLVLLQSQEGLLLGPIQDLIRQIGTSCLSTQSVCLAIAIFLRRPFDFRRGILEAVNAGGDTDTVAAIVGSLIGSVVGLGGIPEEWVNFHPQFQEAVDLGQKLYALKHS